VAWSSIHSHHLPSRRLLVQGKIRERWNGEGNSQGGLRIATFAWKKPEEPASPRRHSRLPPTRDHASFVVYAMRHVLRVPTN